MDFFLATGVFALVFIGALVVMTSRGGESDQKQNLIRRMARPDDEIDVDITRKTRVRESGQVLAILWKLNLLRNLEENMWQAGIYMRVSEMMLIIVLMFCAGLFLGQAVWHDMLFGLGFGVAFALLPIIYIRIRRIRRLRAFIQQLPFALDLVKSSLEAGHSLNRGLQVVVQEFGDPLGSEFRTVLEQTRIGLPLPRALEDMLKRVPEDDLRLLVVAVKVQNDVGHRAPGRNRTHAPAPAVADSRAHRAVANGRDDRRLAAARRARCVQPRPAGLCGYVVQRSDRPEDTQSGDNPRWSRVSDNTPVAEAQVLVLPNGRNRDVIVTLHKSVRL
jgi:Flp pilus assembly protein TadB